MLLPRKNSQTKWDEVSALGENALCHFLTRDQTHPINKQPSAFWGHFSLFSVLKGCQQCEQIGRFIGLLAPF